MAQMASQVARIPSTAPGTMTSTASTAAAQMVSASQWRKDLGSEVVVMSILSHRLAHDTPLRTDF